MRAKMLRFENPIRDMGAYAPPIGIKHFQNVKKNPNFFSMYVSKFYVYVASFAENQHFCVLCKKTKNCLV
jgi:hypothetical protein